MGDADFIGDAEGDAGSLGSVAEGGIVEGEVGHGKGGVAQSRSGGNCGFGREEEMELGIFFLLFLFFEQFEDVLEAGGVGLVGLDESFVSVEDFGGIGAGGWLSKLLHGGGGFWELWGVWVADFADGEELVEAEVMEEGGVAVVGADDFEGAVTGFIAEGEGDAGDGAHEGGVHEFAFGEVDDEFALAAVDHFLAIAFEAGAGLERAAADDAQPNSSAEGACENC